MHTAEAVIAAAAKETRTLDAVAPDAARVAKWLIMVGALVCGLMAFWHAGRFWSAYLVAFTYLLTITLGALFFVIVQHLVKAGWSVAVRRLAEGLTRNFVLLAALFVPLVYGIHQGYLMPLAAAHPVHHGEEAGHGKPGDAAHAAPAPADPNAPLGNWKDGPDLLSAKGIKHGPMNPAKESWLSFKGVMLRFAIYFAVWLLLSFRYWSWSRQQDETRDPAITRKMQFWAPISIVLYALTTTLAGFDLLMALDPHWYSTIFGVIFWAGGFVSFSATLILMLFLLQRRGVLTRSVTPEHYQDVGKFMFAFIVFWAYVSFSQFMLIWYANIPEETVWYQLRAAGGWYAVSLLGLLVGHFVVPFLLLLSRFPKRRPSLLAIGACYVLLVHFVDLFWQVHPQKSPLGHVPVPLLDLGLLSAFIGIYVLSTLKNLAGVPLVPVGDPRLADSLAHQNY